MIQKIFFIIIFSTASIFSMNQAYDFVAHAYERGRPDYPQHAMQHFLENVEYVSGMIVCDLAAGTGKLTKAVRAIDPSANIVAVEPSANMCTICAQEIPDIHVIQASAEHMPLPDESVDIVVIGTAFHWFATEQALREIARILKPGGRLGLIWNIFDTHHAWVRKIRDLLDAYKTSEELLCYHDSLMWKAVFQETTFFAPLQHATYHHEVQGTEDDVLQRVLSSKILGDIIPEEQDKLLSNIRAIVRTYAGSKSTFPIPYRIEMYWTNKR